MSLPIDIAFWSAAGKGEFKKEDFLPSLIFVLALLLFGYYILKMVLG